MSATSDERSATRRVPLADLLLTVGLLAIFAVAFLTARAWSFETGVFPRMITALGVVLALLHLAVLVMRRPAPDLHAHGEDAEIEAVDVEYVFERAGTRLWLRNLGWIAGFFLLLYLAGIFVAAPVFTVAYLRLEARASWLLSVVYAVVVGAMLYLSFVVFLGLPTPPGLLL